MVNAIKFTSIQITAILLCFLMNILDGMDVMIISYSAPAIASELKIEPTQLGIVFSIGLFGMAIGAMFLAAKADKIGRKKMILISAAIMGICVLATAFAISIPQLLVIRFISGIGIGSMLACTATITAEYSPLKSKDFWVSFVMAGYPVGAVLSGMVAAKIIPVEGWRFMFQLAGAVTLLTLPLLFLLLSESLDFLLKAQPKNALSRVNAILKRMHLETLKTLPEKEIALKKANISELVNPEFKKNTLWLWVSIFMAFATLYFLTMWIPKLASNTGLSLNLAIYAGTVFNFGAFFGIILQGYLSSKFGLKNVICFFLVFTALLMLAFGFFDDSYQILAMIAFIGFGIQGGFVGMYAVAAKLYPTQIRSTGVGSAIGIGRVGAVVGPIIGGLLISLGLSMKNDFMIFALPTLIAAIAILKIKIEPLNFKHE